MSDYLPSHLAPVFLAGLLAGLLVGIPVGLALNRLSTSFASQTKQQPESTLCLEMAKHALKTRTEEHKVPGKDFLALHSNVQQTIGNLNVIDQSIFKTMDEEIFLKLGLDKVDSIYTSICRRIVRQESLHPRQYTHPTRQMVIPVPEITWVDTAERVAEMVSMMADNIDLENASSYKPALAIDSEGPLALLQIMLVKTHHAFFIDVPRLGEAAFHISVPTCQGVVSLKAFLESIKVLKLLWDCRGDGAKMRDMVGVSMDCVYDVQLMDSATCDGKDQKRVRSFREAGPQRLRKSIDDETHRDFYTHKSFGKMVFDEGYPTAQRLYTATGGSVKDANKMLKDEKAENLRTDWKPNTDASGEETGTFSEIKKPAPESVRSAYYMRPLPELLVRYAVNDVRFLPGLYEYFTEHRFWNDQWAGRVWHESAARLGEPSQTFEDKEKKKQAPAGWAQVVQVDRFEEN